jgi:hypothetical protein
MREDSEEVVGVADWFRSWVVCLEFLSVWLPAQPGIFFFPTYLSTQVHKAGSIVTGVEHIIIRAACSRRVRSVQRFCLDIIAVEMGYT